MLVAVVVAELLLRVRAVQVAAGPDQFLQQMETQLLQILVAAVVAAEIPRTEQ